MYYKKYMNSTEEPKVFGPEDARQLAEIAEKYGFVDTQYKLYSLKKDFTAEEYLGLLRTYPSHMKLDESDRKKLFEGIYNAIKGNGGVITVYYAMDLEMARK